MTNSTTLVNPHTTAAGTLEKAGRFRQLKGKTAFGEALLKVQPKLNRAWEIKGWKYTGKVLVKYNGKEFIRSKQELVNYLVSMWAMPKLA